MKKFIIAFLLPLCGLAAFAQTTKKAAPVKKTVKSTSVKTAAKPAVASIKTTLDSASYSFGIFIASQMKSEGFSSLNYAVLVKGMQDVFADKPLLIGRDKAGMYINNLRTQVNKVKAEADKKKYAPLIAEGTAFLENNKKQAGVKVTPSGLQYLVLTQGTGVMPKATDTVLVNYKGTLLNGTQFDSSYDRNEPLSLPLSSVIPGWTEGVQLMAVGSKYRFFVPYNLAYGENGAGQDIPPYSTLIFEIELLKVNGK